MGAAVAACATVGGVAALAQPSGLDWKFYGYIPSEGGSLCFYEAKGIRVEADDQVKVWTKCLRQREMDDADSVKEGIDYAARNIAIYYVPPIAMIQQMDSHGIVSVIIYESIADLGNIEPVARIYYELDCHGRRERELSFYATEKGKPMNSEAPLEWKFVPPEGNGAHLLALVCQQS